MTGSIVATPGFIFRSKSDITTANLNSAANPSFVIQDNSITNRELDPDVLGPVCTSNLDPAASLTLTLNADRTVNAFYLELTRNVTSLTLANQVAGQFVFVMIKNSEATPYTFKLPTNVWLSGGAGGPYTITPGSYHLLLFHVLAATTHVMCLQDDLDV